MDNENGIFLGWFFGGLFLIYLPMLFISGRNWFPRTRFIKKYPEQERLVNSYTIALMIWIPLAVVGSRRYFQEETGVTFFLFTFFIPLIGVGIIKGGIEIFFGVSSYVWMRKRKKQYPIVWFRSPLDNWHRLKRIEHRYTQNKERVKRMGAVRILVNIGFTTRQNFLTVRQSFVFRLNRHFSRHNQQNQGTFQPFIDIIMNFRSKT